MLVLSRKTDQEILINGNIKISILKIKGNVVRIGIDAPAEVNIKRGELAAKTSDTYDSIDGSSSIGLVGAVAVKEEPAGYQMLPLPSSNASSGKQCQTTDVTSKFPETFNRNRFCNVIPPKKHSA